MLASNIKTIKTVWYKHGWVSHPSLPSWLVPGWSSIRLVRFRQKSAQHWDDFQSGLCFPTSVVTTGIVEQNIFLLSSLLFPKGILHVSRHFVVLCSAFCSPRSRCTEFPQSWRSRKITDFSSHLFAQVAQTVANKRTMAKNGRGYPYTWCSPMPGTMVGTMEEINHPLVTVAPSVT